MKLKLKLNLPVESLIIEVNEEGVWRMQLIFYNGKDNQLYKAFYRMETIFSRGGFFVFENHNWIRIQPEIDKKNKKIKLTLQNPVSILNALNILQATITDSEDKNKINQAMRMIDQLIPKGGFQNEKKDFCLAYAEQAHTFLQFHKISLEKPLTEKTHCAVLKYLKDYNHAVNNLLDAAKISHEKVNFIHNKDSKYSYLILSDHINIKRFLTYIIKNQETSELLGITPLGKQNIHSYTDTLPKPKKLSRSIKESDIHISHENIRGTGMTAHVVEATKKVKKNKSKSHVFKAQEGPLTEIEAAILIRMRYFLNNHVPKARPVVSDFSQSGILLSEIEQCTKLSDLIRKDRTKFNKIINDNLDIVIGMSVINYCEKNNDFDIHNMSTDKQDQLYCYDAGQSQWAITSEKNEYDANVNFVYVDEKGKEQTLPPPKNALKFSEEDIRNFFGPLKHYQSYNWLFKDNPFQGISFRTPECEKIKYQWFLKRILLPKKNLSAPLEATMSSDEERKLLTASSENDATELTSILLNMPEFQDCVLANPEFIEEIILGFEKVNQNLKRNEDLKIDLKEVRTEFTRIFTECQYRKDERVMLSTDNAKQSQNTSQQTQNSITRIHQLFNYAIENGRLETAKRCQEQILQLNANIKKNALVTKAAAKKSTAGRQDQNLKAPDNFFKLDTPAGLQREDIKDSYKEHRKKWDIINTLNTTSQNITKKIENLDTRHKWFALFSTRLWFYRDNKNKLDSLNEQLKILNGLTDTLTCLQQNNTCEIKISEHIFRTIKPTDLNKIPSKDIVSKKNGDVDSLKFDGATCWADIFDIYIEYASIDNNLKDTLKELKNSLNNQAAEVSQVSPS